MIVCATETETDSTNSTEYAAYNNTAYNGTDYNGTEDQSAATGDQTPRLRSMN